MWLKTSDDFPDDCARVRLSDPAYRTHHEGLSWAMRRENGGQIDALDLRRFAETANPEAAVRELTAAGFWMVTPSGWQIIHAMDDQIEVEVMAKRRTATKERVRKHRLKAAGLEDSGNGVTERVTRPATERVTRVGSESGQGGPGLEELPAHEGSVEDGPVDPWSSPPCGVDLRTGVVTEVPAQRQACDWCGGGGCVQCLPDLFDVEA